MSKNFNTFLQLDKNKLANQYVVIIGGKVIATGTDIEAILKKVRKKFPRAIPFIAKVPEQSLLVLVT